MSTFEPGTTASDLDQLELVDDDILLAGCVVCGAPCSGPGCCSFPCVREARRELDHNVARLRSLQAHESPTATRARLTERNGQLTAALMAWRQ